MSWSRHSYQKSCGFTDKNKQKPRKANPEEDKDNISPTQKSGKSEKAVVD